MLFQPEVGGWEGDVPRTTLLSTLAIVSHQSKLEFKSGRLPKIRQHHACFNKVGLGAYSSRDI
jgi:hypothetical protein